MEIFYWTLYIILALFIGSFLNVVALRVPNNESIFMPPSHCPTCKGRLNFIDLIPVFGFIICRGRCRYCDTKISPIYIFGELLTLLLFILIPIYMGFTIELIVAYLFAILMIIVTISDLKYKIIPDKFVYPGIIIFLLLRIFIHPLGFWDYIIGAFLGGGLLLLIAILSRGGIGGGDIKLFFLIGLVLGWQNTLLTLFLAALLGTIIGGVLMLLGFIKRKQLVPFGPFITVGAMVAYLFGNNIWFWYLNLF